MFQTDLGMLAPVMRQPQHPGDNPARINPVIVAKMIRSSAGVLGWSVLVRAGGGWSQASSKSRGYGLKGDEIYSLLLDAKAAGHGLLSLHDAYLNSASPDRAPCVLKLLPDWIASLST